MGIVQKPDTERDLALIQDYLAKNGDDWVYSISQLGIKYARIEGDEIYPLTAVRIHQILAKYGVPKNRKPVKQKLPKSLPKTE